MRIEAEYSELRKGQRLEAIRSLSFGTGVLAFHGDGESDEDWSLTYVRERDRAVLPLAAGAWSPVEAECLQRQKAGLPLDEQCFPAVILCGVRRNFRAVGGRHLVGVVEFGGVEVLLGATGSSFLVIVRQGAGRHVIPTGPTHGLPELNLDALLPDLDRSAQRARRAKADVRRPEKITDVADHHDRIVHGQVPAAPSERVSVPRAVRQGLRHLADRAAALHVGPARPTRRGPPSKADPRCAVRRTRGARFVYRLVEILQHLGAVGCGDLVGRLGDLHAQIRERLPDESFSAQALSDGLHRLFACKTCLVRKPSPRRWHVRLAGLTDWRTPLHRQFCAETPTEFRLGPDLPGAAERPSPTQPTAPPTAAASSPPVAETGPEVPPNSAPTAAPARAPTPAGTPICAEARAATTATTAASKPVAPVINEAAQGSHPPSGLDPAPAPLETLVPPAPVDTGKLRRIYEAANTQIQEALATAQVGGVAHITAPSEAEALPSASVMTLVASLFAEGIDQVRDELAAVRAEAASAAAAHARERDELVRERRRAESEAKAMVDRAERMLNRLSRIEGTIVGVGPPELSLRET